MAKRTANTDLNHDNWQEEDEPEDAGTFTKAPDDIIEKRVIRVAKRRLASGEGTTRSAFGSFTGFNTTAAATTSSPFSFLANANTTSNSTIKSSTTVNQSPASNGAPKTSDNAGPTKEKSPSKPVSSNTSVPKSEMTEEKDAKIFKTSSEYFAQLKGLNESVAQWIKTHVDSNPFCILTPIFQDYERYLKEIDSKHGDRKETIVKATENTSTSDKPQTKESTSTTIKKSENSPFGSKNISSPSSDQKSIFSSVTNTKSVFGNTEQKTDSKTDFPKSGFNSTESKIENKNIFGSISSEKNPFLSKLSTTTDNKAEETKTSTSPFAQSSINPATFSFGQSSTATTPSAGFSFGSGKPFSFGAQAVKPSDAEEKSDSEEKDDDEEPPKPEFKSVTEEGAIYEQRCKVFVKKDGSFSDRGVGVLFLKPTPTGKTQLIVRADTSLGNLLLNTLLTESIPTKRMNKNTVMMMCLPMPDSQPPPTAVLLRVKTSEDADVLIETLDKHKKRIKGQKNC